MPGNEPTLIRFQRRLALFTLAAAAMLCLVSYTLPVFWATGERDRAAVRDLSAWREELQRRADEYAERAAFDGPVLKRDRAGALELTFRGDAPDARAWLAAGAPGFDPRSYLIDDFPVTRTVGGITWQGVSALRLIAIRGDFERGELVIAIGPVLRDAAVVRPDLEYVAYDRAHRRLGQSRADSEAESLSDLIPPVRRIMNEEILTVELPGGEGAFLVPLLDADQWDVVAYAVVRPHAVAVDLPHLARRYGLALILAAAALLLYRFLSRRLIRKGAAGFGVILLPILHLGALHALVIAARHHFHTDGGSSTFYFSPAGSAALVLTAGLLVIEFYTLVVLARQRTEASLRQAAAAGVFLAPSLLYLSIFFIGPVLFALLISFFDWDLVGAVRNYIGLANYLELFNDPLFWNALWNTLFYSLHVPVAMAIALAVALPLQRTFRGVTILRTLFFLPYITSFVAISTVWQWLYNTDFGLLNYLLAGIGVGPVNWLSDPATAMPAIMVMSIWLQLGYMMVVFIAGLQSIPVHLYEAATLDGAGRWQQFRRITLPLLRPTIFFILVTSVINSFQVFTYVYVMTQGGPLHGTEVLVYQIYRNAWEYFRMGYASAAAWVLFVMVMIVTLIQFTWFRKRMEEAQM